MFVEVEVEVEEEEEEEEQEEEEEAWRSIKPSDLPEMPK